MFQAKFVRSADAPARSIRRAMPILGWTLTNDLLFTKTGNEKPVSPPR